MSNCKATGLGDIGIRLVKVSADFIAPHITSICNASISTVSFPDPWKRARVAPIFKSGDQNDYSNYRPISVLPILYKILERHVYDCLYEYLNTYKLLLNEQSGFWKNCSCQTHLVKLIDHFLENIDNGNLCGIILIDLHKAFDLVDHELMIDRLRLYVCIDTSRHWFLSYLSGRYQRVSYDGHLSDHLPVTLGVPQCSLLWPLFFILFINDLVLKVENAHLEMYADDSILCTAAKSVEIINSILTAQAKPVYCWISINCMVLNVDKTECMLLGTVKRLNSALKDFSVRMNI